MAEERDTSLSGELLNAFKRLGYGVAMTPALPTALYSAPKVAGDIYAAISGKENPISYPGADRAAEITQNIDEWARNLTGTVTPPIQNPNVNDIGDAILEFAPNMMIPGAAIARIPSYLKPVVSTLTPVAATTKTGAALGIGAGVAAPLAVGAMLPEQAEAAQTQEAPNEEVIDISQDMQQAKPVAAEGYDDVISFGAEVEPETIDLTKEFAPEEVTLTGRLIDQFKMLDNDAKAGIAAGAAAVGALAAIKGKALLTKRGMDVAQSSGGGIGESTPMSVGSAAKKAETFLADKQATTMETFSKVAQSADEVTDFENLAYLATNPASLGGLVRSAIQGELPGRSAPMSISLKQFADQAAVLAKEQPDLLQGWLKYKVAANEQENRILRGLPARSSVGSDADIANIVSSNWQNPAYKKLDQQYKSMTDTMIDWLAEPDQFGNAGPITRAQAQQYKEFRHYIPEIEVAAAGRIQQIANRLGAGRLWQGVSGQTGYEFQGFRSLLQREGGSDAPLLNPLDALASYFNQAIRFKYENGLRSKFVDTFELADAQGRLPAELRGLVKKASDATKEGGDVVNVMRDGKTYSYRVRDPVIATMLQTNPTVIAPLMNAFRQLSQTTITGLGAPMFSLSTLLYDVQSIAAMAAKNKTIGVGRGDVLGSLTESLYGVLRGAHGQISNAIADGIEKQLTTRGMLTKMFDERSLRGVADWAASGMSAQLIKMMETRGVLSSGRFTQDLRVVNHVNTLNDISPDYASRFPAATKFLEAYRKTFETIGSGAKIAYAARQFRPDMTSRQIESLMREVGTVTGKYYTKPSSTLLQVTGEAIPYFNVSLQGIRKEMQFLKRHPLAMTTGIAGTVLVPAAASLLSATLSGPEALDDLLSGDPSSNAGYMKFYWPEAGVENSSRVPIWPTMSPLYVAAVRTLASAFGMHNKEIYSHEHGDIIQQLAAFVGLDEEAAMQTFGKAITRALPPIPGVNAMPPAVEAPLAALGHKVSTFEGVQVDQQRSQDPTGLDTTSRRFGADDIALNRSVEAVLEATLHDVAQLGIGMWRAFDQGIRADDMETVFGNLGTGADRAGEFVGTFFGDKVKSVSTLWNHTSKVATTTADTEVLRSKLDGIKFAGGLQRNVENNGFIGATKAGNLHQSPENVAKIDPSLFPVIATAQKVGQSVAQYTNDIAEMRKYINDLNAAPSKGPSDKRQLINESAKQINIWQHEALQLIRAAEAQLSAKTGRKIDFRNLKDAKSLQDFPPMM